MENTEFALIILVLNIIAFVYWYLQAKKQGKNKNASDAEFFYMQGELKQNDFSKTFVASSISLATVFIGISSFAVIYTGDAWWLLISFLFGIPLFLFHLKKLEQNKYLDSVTTLSQILKNGYGDRIKNIAAYLSVIFLLGSIGVEFYVLLNLLKSVFTISFPIIILFSILFSFVFIGYSYAGGYRGIKENDKSQLIALIVASILILFMIFILKNKENVSLFELMPFPLTKIRSSSILIIISSISLMLPWLVSTPDTWHRAKAANFDYTIIKKGFYGKKYINILFFIFTWSIPIIIGVYFTDGTSDEVFISFIHNIIVYFNSLSFILKILIVGFIFVGLFGAILSSIDTLLIGSSFIVCNDILRKYKNLSITKKYITAKFILFVNGMISLLVPLIAFLLGMNIFQVISIVGSSIIILFPSIFILTKYVKNEIEKYKIHLVVFYSLVFSIFMVLISLIIAFYLNDYKNDILSSIPIIGLISSIVSHTILLLISKIKYK